MVRCQKSGAPRPGIAKQHKSYLEARQKMAGNLNRVSLIGNLTHDPEYRRVDNTKAVTKFNLAVNRKTKTGAETLFIDIVTWEQLAENANKYLKKGMSVYVEGRLVIRPYETKEGEKRKAIEVVARNVQFLDKKAAGESNGSTNGNGTTHEASHDDYDDSEMDEELVF